MVEAGLLRLPGTRSQPGRYRTGLSFIVVTALSPCFQRYWHLPERNAFHVKALWVVWAGPEPGADPGFPSTSCVAIQAAVCIVSLTGSWRLIISTSPPRRLRALRFFRSVTAAHLLSGSAIRDQARLSVAGQYYCVR